MTHKYLSFLTFLVTLLFTANMVHASPNVPHLDVATMSLLWNIPFVAMLLSIALFPLIAPHFWHNNFGKVSLFLAATFIVPFGIVYGKDLALYELAHAIILEYIPFIVLLFALYTVSGGIEIKNSFYGNPKTNTILLLLGTAIASIIGTTGASVVLIRPLLHANSHRRYKVHTVIFFIFLVSNIGGSLTPLGDPPLFLGFLNGIHFFWTTQHMLLPMVCLSAALLALYYILDTVLYKKELVPSVAEDTITFSLRGKINFLFLACIIGAVLLSGFWKPNIHINIFSIPTELQNIVRDILLIFFALLSLRYTPTGLRKDNNFSWFPIHEVAKLFIGIFITMIAPITILKAGAAGPLKDVIALLSTPQGEPIPSIYFWLTGMLSSFLDNAPTYLVFFNTAGGNPLHLMTEVQTLLAISMGAVFMGANTYIGNAPNFMVRSIAEQHGVKMPSFFGYLLWSFGILVPLFIVITLLFL